MLGKNNERNGRKQCKELDNGGNIDFARTFVERAEEGELGQGNEAAESYGFKIVCQGGISLFNRKSGKKFIFLLFIGLLIVAAISLTCGQIKIPLHNTLSAIGYQLGLPFFDKNDFTQEQMAVVWYIRMPRMVVGLLVGAALGISGAVMQGIFSNPLADPGIIGVSSGAATGAVLSIALGWATESMFVMPAFAFCG